MFRVFGKLPEANIVFLPLRVIRDDEVPFLFEFFPGYQVFSAGYFIPFPDPIVDSFAHGIVF